MAFIDDKLVRTITSLLKIKDVWGIFQTHPHQQLKRIIAGGSNLVCRVIVGINFGLSRLNFDLGTEVLADMGLFRGYP